MPACWARFAVPDAHEPCPACGEVAWDEVHPADESRGARGTSDGHWEPTPAVVCRSCGHEERIGSIQRVYRNDDQDPAEVARRVEAAAQAMRSEDPEQLATVGFPIYAAEGWTATLAGLGGSSPGIGQGIDRASIEATALRRKRTCRKRLSAMRGSSSFSCACAIYAGGRDDRRLLGPSS